VVEVLLRTKAGLINGTTTKKEFLEATDQCRITVLQKEMELPDEDEVVQVGRLHAAHAYRL
jgi:hypothetical protein